ARDVERRSRGRVHEHDRGAARLPGQRPHHLDRRPDAPGSRQPGPPVTARGRRTAVIPLHRLTHPDDPVYVNPDLISTIEANPDTVVTFVNASKLVVAESAEAVTELVCDWRARVVA